jgi:PrtD family type I secretion system ABC transporter
VKTKSVDIRRTFIACSPAFIATGVFSFFLNLLMLVVPLYMLQVFDRVLSSRSESTLLMLTILAGFMLLVLGILEAVRARVLVRTGVRFEGLLKDRVFTAVFERSVGAPGATRTQALQDLDVLRQFLTGSGLFALLDAPWAPIFIGVIFLLHPWLGIASLVGALVLFTLALLNETLTSRPLKAASERAIKANNFAETSLNNAEVLKAMGMLGGIRARWYQHRLAAVSHQARASDRAGLVVASTKVVRLYIQVLLLGIGAYLTMQQLITPGSMIAAAILLGRALAPVEQAVGNWRGFVAARAALGRLKELLDAVPVDKPSMRLPRPEGRVQFEQVIAAAPGGDPGTPILKGVSFQLMPGGALGIIGPTAAGKSTLARLLVGIWRATRGTVRLDGADVFEWSRADLGSHIGYQPQEVTLFDGTVAENIARFGKVDAEAVVAAARKAAAHELILRLPGGYDTLIGAYGHTLSGGQRQRIGLARALYGDPSLIVLDEPNTNLDQPGERALLATIAELKQAGKTLVIIAHRPNILASVDQILCLNEGFMDMLGSRDEVIARFTLPPPSLPPPEPGRIVSIADKRKSA